MSFPRVPRLSLGLSFVLGAGALLAQEYGSPDRGAPGDLMIQEWLAAEAGRVQARLAADLTSREAFERLRPRYQEEYLTMLGLDPLPPRQDPGATVTGKIEGDGFVVEKLHYQSVPGLYVTANLYRPRETPQGKRLPGVLYVCGHSNMARNGNKTAYQSHGIWLARHGFVALLVDSLQLGEIGATHHGTYREGRWWWHSRGYTPAGVECWNGVRGLDYLASRADVAADQLAVTGISGGGAATFWIAAADERVVCAAPVSGMADLVSYVGNRVLNGHCDCMFLYNAFQWPWTRIAALVAPRALCFANSDQDPLFPMDANERVSSSLERIYSLFGASHRFETLVSVGGHAYRRDLREGVFRFLSSALKGDAREISDSEVSLVQGEGAAAVYPIPPESLRVFPGDADLPRDQLNTTIDERFVPLARVAEPGPGGHARWKAGIMAGLRRLTFGALQPRVPAAREVAPGSGEWIETEPGIRLGIRTISRRKNPPVGPRKVLLAIDRPGQGEAPTSPPPAELGDRFDLVLALETRGTGRTAWTRKNPPNFVERAHVLLGRTVDTSRVLDTIAAARWLRAAPEGQTEVTVFGSGPAAQIALFAALLEEEDIAGVMVEDLPESARDEARSAQFLNWLRVCDLEDLMGLLAPRPVEVESQAVSGRLKKARRIHALGGGSGPGVWRH